MGKAKRCTACGHRKPLDEFYEHPMMADGHLGQCITCNNAASRARWATRMADPAERAKERDRLAAHRAANPDGWRAARQRAQAKFYAAGKWREARRVRRARATPPPGGNVSLSSVLRRYGRHCHICDKAISDGQSVHFDHVIPLSRGGTHVEDNLRPSHGPCNSWKGDRLMLELAGMTAPAPEEIPAYVRELRRQRRAEQTRARMAAMTPEQRAERAARISAAKMGKPSGRAGVPRGPRKVPATSEEIERRSASVRAAYAKWTPEQSAEHARKISATKRARGDRGNIANLIKGRTPEVRARALAAAAASIRGKPQSEAHRAAISAGIKRAYAEGRRVAGHSPETCEKIRATKLASGQSRGERNPSAKLTVEKVREIRDLIARGIPMTVIAARFGVGHSTIGRIKAGTHWK